MTRSVLIAGFEAWSYRTRRGLRVDLAQRTQHDRLVALDYARAAAAGFGSVRASARWPVIEARPWHYDFSPLVAPVRAARALGVEILWTLVDGSWPGDLDPLRPAFVRRVSAFARATARFLRDELDAPPCVIPIEQITARAWLGAELGHTEPYLEERGFELQAQLVRAAIAAADAFRDVLPHARIACAEPLFHVAPAPERPQDIDAAAAAAARRFEVTDMLCGRAWPQLGGEARHLDVVGVIVLPDSQWYYGGPKLPGRAIEPHAPAWRPLHAQLREVVERYARPVQITASAGTGAFAPGWLRYVCREARSAVLEGATVAGITIGPALDREAGPAGTGASAGLWGEANAEGRRSVRPGLATEIALQRTCFERLETVRRRRRNDGAPFAASMDPAA